MASIKILDKERKLVIMEGVRVTRIGNSLGIIIPALVIDSMEIEDGDYIAEIILRLVKNKNGGRDLDSPE